MTALQALETCKANITSRGYRLSAGSWGDDEMACAFSLESFGPSTYGHPRFTSMARLRGGVWVDDSGSILKGGA